MNRKIRVVRPPLIDEILVNPGIGFTTFQRFNGDALNEGKKWTEGFPIVYQPDTGSRVNVNHPPTSIAYFRVYWRYIQPEKDVYRWDLIDEAMAVAKRRGQTLMLRVGPHGTCGNKAEDVPDWFRQLVGEDRSWVTEAWMDRKWMVDNRSPLYVEHFGNFIRAMGQRYNGHPDLESVDVAVVGAWGESEGIDVMPDAAMTRLVDAYVDTFTSTPLLMMLYEGNSCRYALSKRAVGYRADCLGDMRTPSDYEADHKYFQPGGWCHMLDLYPRRIILAGMQDAWKKAPVSFEVCWVVQHWLDMGWDIDYIIDQSLKWHISSFNAKSSPIPPVLEPKINRWLKKMGYRLAVRRFAFPEQIARGELFPFTSWIENLGVAPCYKPFEFAIRLKGPSASFVFKTSARIMDWLPGDSVFDSAIPIASDVPPGEYAVQVGIVDPRTDAPAVKLAMAGITSDGWYHMDRVTVV
jgi:hypothetical protein